MERNEIIRKTNEILVDRLDVEHGVIREDSTLKDDLGADSLDCVEVLMEVEKEFDVSIPDEEAFNITTVKEVYDIIEKKV